MTLRVLFIGGTGQISFDCVHESVRAGYATFVFNRGNSNDGLPPQTHFLTGDIENEGAYGALGDERFDVVCQFRAFTPQDIERDLAVFGGQCGQYVFISSASAYQKPQRRYLITEDVPLENPYWEYSRLKAAAEDVLKAQSSLRYTIVRPSHTVRTAMVTALSERQLAAFRMLEGRPIIVPGDGNGLWTVTRSQDFAVPFARLFGNDRAYGEAYHLTRDTAFLWNEIYRATGRALGVEPDLVHVPSDTLIKYRPDWRGPLFGDKMASVVFDNSKIRSVVGDFGCARELDVVLAGPLRFFENHRAAMEKTRDRELDAVFDRIAADQRALGSL